MQPQDDAAGRKRRTSPRGSGWGSLASQSRRAACRDRLLSRRPQAERSPNNMPGRLSGRLTGGGVIRPPGVPERQSLELPDWLLTSLGCLYSICTDSWTRGGPGNWCCRSRVAARCARPVESVVALAPAGGWPKGDESFKELLSFQLRVQAQATASAARAGAIVASADGRRRATELVVTNFEHIPSELIAHQIVGVASCKGASALIAYAISRGTGSRRRGSPVRCGWCGARPTSCCRGRPPLHASEMTGSPPPTGSSWRALVTARSSMSRWRPHS
jgi:hypothetical protein